MIVSRVKVDIVSSDGSTMKMDLVMPHEVIMNLVPEIYGWESDWVATTKTTKEFLASEKNYLEEIRQNEESEKRK